MYNRAFVFYIAFESLSGWRVATRVGTAAWRQQLFLNGSALCTVTAASKLCLKHTKCSPPFDSRHHHSSDSDIASRSSPPSNAQTMTLALSKARFCSRTRRLSSPFVPPCSGERRRRASARTKLAFLSKPTRGERGGGSKKGGKLHFLLHFLEGDVDIAQLVEDCELVRGNHEAGEGRRTTCVARSPHGLGSFHNFQLGMSRLFAPPRPFLLRLSLPIPLRHLSTRAYLYTLDHLGQLFLASTKLRNFTSCYKEKTFLDLYYRRLRPNAGEPPGSVAAALREQGYTWISPCGNETNYLKPDETPLVFQRLEDGCTSRLVVLLLPSRVH